MNNTSSPLRDALISHVHLPSLPIRCNKSRPRQTVSSVSYYVICAEWTEMLAINFNSAASQIWQLPCHRQIQREILEVPHANSDQAEEGRAERSSPSRDVVMLTRKNEMHPLCITRSHHPTFVKACPSFCLFCCALQRDALKHR